jgi:hypothetical protein
MKKLILIFAVVALSFSASAINCFTMTVARGGGYVVNVYTSNANGDRSVHLHASLYNDQAMAVAMTDGMITCCPL